MAWFRIALTDAEQAVVNAERDSHPESHVRRKMLALWLLHCGLTRAHAAEVTGLGRATVSGTWRPTGRAGWTACGGGTWSGR